VRVINKQSARVVGRKLILDLNFTGFCEYDWVHFEKREFKPSASAVASGNSRVAAEEGSHSTAYVNILESTVTLLISSVP
jgi:hypothetical protein